MLKRKLKRRKRFSVGNNQNLIPFQFSHLREGRLNVLVFFKQLPDFNSRPCVRGDTLKALWEPYKEISIHAPA